MHRLPPELLGTISEELSAHDLRSLRQLNKTWHGIVTPRAFRCLSVSCSLESSEGLANILQGGPNALASHIREINYFDLRRPGRMSSGNESAGGNRFMTRNEDPLVESLKRAFSLLSNARGLSKLYLMFSPIWPENSNSSVLHSQSVILSAVLDALESGLSLHFLSLVHLSVFRSLFWRRLSFSALRTLSEFHISTLSDPTEDPISDGTYPNDPLSQFWEGFFPKQVLQAINGSSTLTALSLHSDQLVGVIPSFTLEPFTFPCLTSLSLRRILLHETTGVEEFIVRHKATLRSLVLKSCFMAFYDNPGAVRFWSQVWNRFAEELTQLTTFMAREDHEYARSETDGLHYYFSRYIRVVGDLGFIPCSRPIPGEEDDERAFTNLEALVSQRGPALDGPLSIEERSFN